MDPVTIFESISLAVICGLVIATLSFDASIPHQADLLAHAKLGIVCGSLLSGVIAFLWLHMALPKGIAPDAAED